MQENREAAMAVIRYPSVGAWARRTLQAWPSGQASLGQNRASSTSPEVFGAVALAVPPDRVTGAVTLAQEIQHVKLGAPLDVVTLTLPDDGGRYYAP
jgi:HEXXH motif-containing protein